MPKMTVENSTMRITCTVSACAGGGKPGAMTVLTSQGAKIQAMAASTPVTITTRLVMAAASRQAPGRSPSVRKSAKMGMNAVASAPPATTANNRSGSLKAA